MRALLIHVVLAATLGGPAMAQSLNSSATAAPAVTGRLRLDYQARDPEWWTRSDARAAQVATPAFWEGDTNRRSAARVTYGLTERVDVFIGADRQGRRPIQPGDAQSDGPPRRKVYAIGVQKRW